MSRSNESPIQHWAYLRFVVIALGLLGLLIWRFSTLPGHATATPAALLIGTAFFGWLDAWLRGPDKRVTRLRDAALLTVVALVFILWLR